MPENETDLPHLDHEDRNASQGPSVGRAMHWRLRNSVLTFHRLPLLMGIVNVTPDSFSDGGKFQEHQAAIDHALELVEQGADILDIGGESTRPYSVPVDLDEELRRTLPVVQAICEQTRVPVSIDTSKAKVAAEAVAAGAEIINDVTGLEGDPAMLGVALESGAGVCVMHTQGTPQTMQDNPTYGDVVEDILAYLRGRRDVLLAGGIPQERICLDPGIGFGKTHQHNLTLLAQCRRFHELRCPLLVGHSRKGFIAHVLGDKQTDRTAGTVGVALAVARQGVQILRVHDVLPVKQALLLFDAVGGVQTL
jgi:dihydropteroate synthase